MAQADQSVPQLAEKVVTITFIVPPDRHHDVVDDKAFARLGISDTTQVIIENAAITGFDNRDNPSVIVDAQHRTVGGEYESLFPSGAIIASDEKSVVTHGLRLNRDDFCSGCNIPILHADVTLQSGANIATGVPMLSERDLEPPEFRSLLSDESNTTSVATYKNGKPGPQRRVYDAVITLVNNPSIAAAYGFDLRAGYQLVPTSADLQSDVLYVSFNESKPTCVDLNYQQRQQLKRAISWMNSQAKYTTLNKSRVVVHTIGGGARKKPVIVDLKLRLRMIDTGVQMQSVGDNMYAREMLQTRTQYAN